MSTLLLGGNHRGGEAIVRALQEKTVRRYEPDWLFADPKGDRAAQLARTAKDHFPTLRPKPLHMRVQDALPLSREHDTVVLALDTIGDTRETLAARRATQRVTYQISGRGPGGVAGSHIALQGTLCPGDRETQRAISLLLPTLGGMSQAASSRSLTGPDPLTAAVLQPLRQAASRQTARHLGELERDPWDLTGGPLSVFFAQTAYPLIPVHGGVQEKYSQRIALALESAGGVPASFVSKRGLPGLFVVVAVVIPQARTVHFMRVALHRTGKRRVAGVTSFVSPVTPSASAVFTD
jgi:hypothetical protein